jgi:hypothetical protein
MTKKNESGEDSSIEKLIDIPASLERAHRTGERAAQQFTKLLGTVHGGLGVILAAWLQRLFDGAPDHALPPLVWYLAGALVFVALGLVLLVLAAIIDQRSAFHFALSTQLNAQRFIVARRRVQIKLLKLQGDEKSAEELECAEQDAEIVRQIKLADASARRINRISEWVGIGSWACAIATFATLAVGIARTICHFGVVG